MSFIKYDLERIVKDNHPLKKVSKIINFKAVALDFKDILKGSGRKGYGLELGIRALFLQFYYDLSDRQLEERLHYDIAMRWFCKLAIDDDIPDHTYFCRIRKILGAGGIAKILIKINRQAKKKGLMHKVFSFIDSSAVKAKETTWQERDKAVKEGEESLNNTNIERYSADKDACFGCKGKNKFWYGYKKHISVDMGSGLINKIAVPAANITDQEGLKYICPNSGMVFADKQYCCKKAQGIISAKNCHSGAILKNNMKGKNRDKDRWISKIRAPFEMVFSKMSNRARYRGLAKVKLQVFLEAVVFNIKKLVVLNSPPLFAAA